MVITGGVKENKKGSKKSITERRDEINMLEH